MKKDASHRLLDVATVEAEAMRDPKLNEAILAVCSLFKPQAENQARRQPSFIEKSLPTGDA